MPFAEGDLKVEDIPADKPELGLNLTNSLPLTIYTEAEKLKALEAIKMLLRWRDDDREKGLIDW